MGVRVTTTTGTLAKRTLRSLAGVNLDEVTWHVQAGCWRPREAALRLPKLPESTPFLGIGAVVESTDQPGVAAPPIPLWREVLQCCGGDFTRAGSSLPAPMSLLLNAAAQQRVGSALPEEIIAQGISEGWQIIRLDALDVCLDTRLRVLQVVTSVQRGGAERLVLDLHEELPRQGVASRLLVLGSPARASYESPIGMISLAHLPADPQRRADEVARLARQLGVDVIHAHLLNGETLRCLRAHGIPVVTTIHNQCAGWPQGLADIQAQDADLLIACSRAVEADLKTLPVVSRTVWNGIRTATLKRDETRAWREKAGFGEQDLVLVTLANPRPQKRLSWLVEVLVALRLRLPSRRVGLMLAGEAAQRDPAALAETELFWQAVDAQGLRRDVYWPGAVEDVAGFLSAADVFVSTSAHEGLSLAQLEALALGLPVVTTDVGGAPEIAREHPQVRVVGGQQRGQIIAGIAQGCLEVMGLTGASLASSFTTPVMTARHRWLYHCVLSQQERRAKTPRGLLLIANNFSTGGAQSSARRLLKALKREGEDVRAAILQEEADHPTSGRLDLIAHGIPVLPLPTPEGRDPVDIVLPLLEAMAENPPAAVMFWNVIPSCKLLIAEALWDTPVFEVSPGEMLFDSWEKFFSNPRPGLPYLEAKDYGQHLAGVVVKYAEEKARAEATFGLRVQVIPNGVPERTDWPASSGLRSPRTRLAIGTAARLNPQKKLEDLLAAFRRVHQVMPEVILRIAGGEERGFEAYAETLRASCPDLPVEWLGEVQDMPAFHDSLDVFAMISEPSGCPNASLEAMASGLPIVATAVGGAVDQVRQGETGFLTPRGDADAFSKALLTLLQDADLRARMAAAAQCCVQEQFSMRVMVDRYRALISASP